MDRVEDAAVVVLPGDIDAAHAGEARADLVRALGGIERSLTIDLDGEGAASPLSLQLLIAALRTPRAAGVRPSPRAAAALAAVGIGEV
jgi:anti-anti-sigma regulatory factor